MFLTAFNHAAHYYYDINDVQFQELVQRASREKF